MLLNQLVNGNKLPFPIMKLAKP